MYQYRSKLAKKHLLRNQPDHPIRCQCQEVPILPKSKYLPPSVPTYDNSVDGGWNLTLLIYSLIITIQVMNEMEHMFWSKGVLPPNLDFR